METEPKLRPWQLLPLPAPCDFDPGPEYFYNNFVTPISIDIIKLMCTGLHIDDNAVEELRSTIDAVLSNVDSLLLRNKIINKLQAQRAVVAQKVHFAKSTEAIRTIDYYIKDYDEKQVLHRTWVVNTYLKFKGWEDDVKDSWKVNDLKKYNIFKTDVFLERLLDKSISETSEHLKAGMLALAKYKMELWNRPRYEKGNSKAALEPFNQGSAKQLQELFSMLNIEPMEVSAKTGDASWGRKYIEMLLKISNNSDKEYEEVLQCIIDHSFSGIIRSTFLKAFDTYTMDNVLHGNVKVWGTKTFRLTSNSPSLLNMPSSGSIYAKPLKKCLVAPEGMLVIQCDFASLEDRILANLSGDVNKTKIFTDKLDGHSLAAVFYKPKEAAAIIGEFTDKVEASKTLKRMVDEGNEAAIKFRGGSKAITFKLAYLGHPDAHKGGAITEEIYNAYHNEMYPGIAAYKDKIIDQVKVDGYLHMGLGARIYTDDVDTDERTLFNSVSQVWSVLTLIALNEINHRILEAGYEKDIQICSSIYDSIYAYITPDPEIVRWYNNNIYEIGGKDFMTDQVVPNILTCGIGRNWAEEVLLPIDASIGEIQEILNTLVDSQ